MEKKLTRKDAASRGLLKYTTGKPCRNGHNTYRYTKTGVCVGCTRLHSQRYAKQLAATNVSGFITVTYRIHKADAPVVERLVSALILARSI